MHRLLTGPLTTDRVEVSIADLPPQYNGLRLVQLSDFHFDGLRLSETMLEAAIAASNAAQPDLVMLTGDFVTDDPCWIHALVPWLQKLHSRYGTYAVLGNHDLYYRRSRSEIIQALTAVGITVLWNEIAYPLGPGLPIVGLVDKWSPQFNPVPVMEQLDPAVPRIVLSHNPDSAAHLQRWRVDLQLSGHTHGGQVVLPGAKDIVAQVAAWQRGLPKPVQKSFPRIVRSWLRTVQHWEWAAGLHVIDRVPLPTEPPLGHPPPVNQLYVNRGLGTYLPGRLFCPPEVTVITLRAEDKR